MKTIAASALTKGTKVTLPGDDVGPTRTVTAIGPVRFVDGRPTFLVELDNGIEGPHGTSVRVTPSTRFGLVY